jgi:hypothetical protein
MSDIEKNPLGSKDTPEVSISNGEKSLLPQTLIEAKGIILGGVAGLGISVLALVGLTYTDDSPTRKTEIACSALDSSTCEDSIDGDIRFNLFAVSVATVLGGFTGGEYANRKEKNRLRKLNSQT